VEASPLQWRIALASLILLLLPARLPAQGVEYVKANYTKFEYRIPMRDGVRLFTIVYVPKDSSQKYPLLIHRIAGHGNAGPYGAAQYRGDLGPSALFAREGYIFVYQDVRGRYMSEGTHVHMRPHNPAKKGPQDIDESSDTYDSIEWLLRHVPNHNGKVGLYGSSYRGFYTAAGIIDAHPALKAASPQAPIVDWFMGDDWHHNGALFLTQAFSYLWGFERQGATPIKKEQMPPFEYGTPDGYDFFLRMGPLANVDARHFKGQSAFWNEMMKHDTYDEFWKARNLRPHLKNIKPAVMVVGGWLDAENLFGPLEAYRHIETHSPGATNILVMGPWVHGGWTGGRSDGSALGPISFHSKTAEFYREKIELPFFEHHLKGKGTFSHPEAWVFETGTNQWRQYRSWPPADTKPWTLYFHGRGRLATEPPGEIGESAFDEYVSDPAKPVPYMDKVGVRLIEEYVVADQRFAARRPDVLVYETEPLEKDVTLVGPIQVELAVSTTGTDSDWVVKLIDVYPDATPPSPPSQGEASVGPPSQGEANSASPPSQGGAGGVRLGGYQQLIRADVMRGKFRNSFEKPEPFIPGKPTAVRFKLLDVCHTFRAGHKIMVQVQSSWFPLVDRNPQTFVNIHTARESDFQKATQRVYRSKEWPSRLVANVLP
jgi:hypothetical protein